MMSCTFPTQTATTGTWSIQGECEMLASHPCYRSTEAKENTDDQILDFKKLESDIIKNVLCEDSCEDEQTFPGAVFPSFNYAPVPTPPTLARLKLTKPYRNGLLVLEPKNGSPLEIRPTSKQARSSSSSFSGSKASERRKMNHKKSYSKIFDTSSSRERLGVTNAKQSGKKLLKNQGLKNNVPSNSSARSTKPQAVISIARRQWNHNPINHPCSPSPYLKQNPFAIKVEDAKKTNVATSRSNLQSDNLKTNLTANTLTLSSVFDLSAKKDEKESPTNVCRSGTQRRNLTLRQSTRSDQKKRKIGERTTKTFAQIVAAGPAVNPKGNYRFYKI